MNKLVKYSNRKVTFTDDINDIDDMMTQLDRNNTFLPEIVNIIYNVGSKAYPVLDENGKVKKDENGKPILGKPVPVLATTVFFADDTKVSVVNSVHDGITFVPAMKTETRVDENGKSYEVQVERGFQVASDSSKEAGLVYAIVKRIFGKEVKNPVSGKTEFIGDGLGNMLRTYISDAYDTRLAADNRKLYDAERRAADEARRKEDAARKAKRRPGLAQLIETLNANIEKLVNR